MEKVKNNKRIEWIDSLKGAMMLAVIWSHSSANNTSGGYWITASYMAVFYFLSGYIFKDKNNGFPKFLLGKAKRLLIPYFSYGTLLVLIDAFIPMTPDDFVIEVLLINGWAYYIVGICFTRITFLTMCFFCNHMILHYGF